MLCGLCGVVITILINMRYTINLILIIALFAIVACTDNNRSHTGKDVTGVVYSAIKAHDKERALALTDSMERAGAITAPQADLLRGNTYDFSSDKKRLGELYYKKSYDALKSDPAQDWATYSEAGYRYSALLGMRLDMEGSLAVATEMMKVAEQKKDFPGDYKWSLLMHIAYCQAELHQHEEATKTFNKAYEAACEVYGGEGSGEFNLMVIEGNIFSYLLGQKKYTEAGDWLERFKRELAAYEQHGDSALIEEYKGHLALQQALLLQNTGHSREAAAIYDAIPSSRIVNRFGVDEVISYLMAAGRYAEAADSYELVDSVYASDDNAKMNFDNIAYRLTSRYMANFKAGRMDNALKLGTEICEAIDSALVWQKKDDVAELAIIYQTQEKEMALEKSQVESRIHRILLISALIIIILISYQLYRAHNYNKVLTAKNRKLYEEIEQREHEQQRVIDKLEATPETNLNANQQLYCQICEIMKNPDIFTEPDTNQDTLASLIGTNRTYIYEAIRECSNQTPSDFINGYRLRYAANLLATTNHSVSLIAELCGLSRRTFYRLFNDAYSMSPSDYRQVADKTQNAK